MNKEQIREILTLIDSAYPNFLPEDDQRAGNKVNLWRSFLEKWDYDRTLKNVYKHVSESRFEPKISEIKPRVKEFDKAWEKEIENL